VDTQSSSAFVSAEHVYSRSLLQSWQWRVVSAPTAANHWPYPNPACRASYDDFAAVGCHCDAKAAMQLETSAACRLIQPRPACMSDAQRVKNAEVSICGTDNAGCLRTCGCWPWIDVPTTQPSNSMQSAETSMRGANLRTAHHSEMATSNGEPARPRCLISLLSAPNLVFCMQSPPLLNSCGRRIRRSLAPHLA